MTLVEFFEADSISSLEKDVNDFLNTLRGFEDVVDVKYNHILLYHSGYDSHNEILYTAMVIYRNPVPEAAAEAGGYDSMVSVKKKDKDPI